MNQKYLWTPLQICTNIQIQKKIYTKKYKNTQTYKSTIEKHNKIPTKHLRTRGKLLGIPTGLEASNENLLQTQSNGQNHADNHSEKNMLNLEMVEEEF